MRQLLPRQGDEHTLDYSIRLLHSHVDSDDSYIQREWLSIREK